jgi:leader peptidase (prepilin peptidase)/N-methyltransferase
VLELLAQSPAAFIAVALAVGLVVGSFLNVVIYRLPIMLERQWQAESAALVSAPAGAAVATAIASEPPFNLVLPRSSCPACHAPIAAIHNIPLLSYLALRGRCARCKAAISAR